MLDESKLELELATLELEDDSEFEELVMLELKKVAEVEEAGEVVLDEIKEA
jgi:hypothetical protein